MNWQDICSHPSLKDLPFKLETDRWGHIVMSPATNRHSRLQSLIARLFDRTLPEGEGIVECSIATAEGVKVADVAWAGAAFLRRHGSANPYPEAPEIVVEVLSDSNTRAEMDEKRLLYFECGAREFWLCTPGGELLFFDANGLRPSSRLAPAFPARLVLPFDA